MTDAVGGEAPSSGPRHAAQMADAAPSVLTLALVLVQSHFEICFIYFRDARPIPSGSRPTAFTAQSPPLGLVGLVFGEKTD